MLALPMSLPGKSQLKVQSCFPKSMGGWVVVIVVVVVVTVFNKTYIFMFELVNHFKSSNVIKSGYLIICYDQNSKDYTKFILIKQKHALTGGIKLYSCHIADKFLNIWMICSSKDCRKSLSPTFPESAGDNSNLNVSETVSFIKGEWPPWITLGKFIEVFFLVFLAYNFKIVIHNE